MIARIYGQLPAPVQRIISRVMAGLRGLGLTRLMWRRKRGILRGYGVNAWSGPGLRYLLTDPEIDNFTYELANEEELVAFVAQNVGVDPDDVRRWIGETREDPELTTRLERRLRRRPDRKTRPQFGRRLGWYAIARAVRPALIVETGIHDGLGSLLLLRALERNSAEGAPGKLISVDINRAAGWLVPDELRGRWRPVYGSTFTELDPAIGSARVGMLIHDSDHTYECEHFEFSTAVAHADETLALVSDNAHATSALRDVCRELGIEYAFFGEKPLGHFYPGAGIGFGLLRRG